MRKLWGIIKSWFRKLTGSNPAPTPTPTPEPEPNQPPTDLPPGLPQNPRTGANKPGSISQYFTAKRKSGDQTYRFSWPSYFTDTLGVREGSICTANGMSAEYRGQDGDNGANRPKYTLPLSVKLEGEVLFILYDKLGNAVGWIKCGIPENGCYLPEQAK